MTRNPRPPSPMRAASFNASLNEMARCHSQRIGRDVHFTELEYGTGLMLTAAFAAYQLGFVWWLESLRASLEFQPPFFFEAGGISISVLGAVRVALLCLGLAATIGWASGLRLYAVLFVVGALCGAGLMNLPLTLALLTLPVVIVATEEALAAVPMTLKARLVK